MAERVIEITRDELVLGSLPETEALELLRLGFFRPADGYRHRQGEAQEFRPLAELSAAVASSSGAAIPSGGDGRIAWLNRARAAVGTAAGTVVSSAGGVVGRVRSFIVETPAAVTQATNAMLEGYLPQIRAALASVSGVGGRAIQAVHGGVRDDEFMRKTFGAVYDCLPRPVCRFVNEERFISFCLAHRNHLIAAGNPGENVPHEPSAPLLPEPDPYLDSRSLAGPDGPTPPRPPD